MGASSSTCWGGIPTPDQIDEYILTTIASYPGFSEINEPDQLLKAKIIVERMKNEGLRPITARQVNQFLISLLAL